jgi:hypothetical protein
VSSSKNHTRSILFQKPKKNKNRTKIASARDQKKRGASCKLAWKAANNNNNNNTNNNNNNNNNNTYSADRDAHRSHTADVSLQKNAPIASVEAA